MLFHLGIQCDSSCLFEGLNQKGEYEYENKQEFILIYMPFMWITAQMPDRFRQKETGINLQKADSHCEICALKMMADVGENGKQ